MIDNNKYNIFYNRSTNSAEFCECLYHPLTFYTSQIINPFLTLRLSANRDKRLEFKPIVKSLYFLMFLYCRIFFQQINQNFHDKIVNCTV